MSGKTCNIVVLLSGSGSNLQALIDACNSGQLHANIVGVISNRPDALGLTRAKQAGIPTHTIDHTDFDSRLSFDQELQKHIDQLAPDLVILSGFMRILTPQFVQHYRGRLLNIHPSLLPKYPGLNTHQRAIDAGDNFAGATVHFVTEELDGGPAIIQASTAINIDDTADTLAQRILSTEHTIYPLAAQWFAEGRLKLASNNATLDGQTLGEGGYPYQSS